RFRPPALRKAPIVKFDSDGLGDEPNNRIALASMTAYRKLRYGRHVDLVITDHHSYTMEDPSGRPEADPFNLPEFPNLFPQEVMEVLDGGRAYAAGNPPAT